MKKIKDFIKNHKILVISIAILALVVISVLLFGAAGVWYDLIIAMIVGIIATDMKKHGLLKVLTIILLLIMLVTNFLPGRQEIISRVGIADMLLDYLSIVLQNFSYIVLFVLSVGGFYGVLIKTPAYKKLLDKIVTKVKPYSKKILYLIIIIFAVVTSMTSMTLPLFIFIPFVVAIILLLGYDKLVAFTTTFGSIMIGYIGGVFVNFINPNTYMITTFDEFVGAKSKFANLYPRLLLLFAGIALLIYFVNRHIKNVEEKKVKYDLNDNSELLIAEVKGDYKDIKTWPIILILAFVFVILVIGIIPWIGLFNIEVFSNFHEWLLSLSIKDYSVFGNTISSNLPALGEWMSNGNFMAVYIYSTMLIIFATIVTAVVNKVKANEMIENFAEGAKKLVPAAALITIAFMVLVGAYNNGFLEVIISKAITAATYKTKIQAILSLFGLPSLLSILGCILNVDTTWIVAGVYSPILSAIEDETLYNSLALLYQGIYGIVSFVGPTSLILILGLSYLDIPYTTWLKYIWRFVLGLVILLALVVVIGGIL